MNIFRSMMSVNFRVDEKGETIFFHPVFGGVWSPCKGYRIASDEDVEKLKRYLQISYGILLFVFVPIAAVLVVRIPELKEGNLFIAYLLGCVVFGVLYVLIVDRLLIRSVIRKYEPTAERLRFSDIQRLQAESQSWSGLISSALFFLFFLLAGLFGVLSGLAVVAGVFLVVMMSLAGAQTAYQIVLKRQGNNGSDRD